MSVISCFVNDRAGRAKELAETLEGAHGLELHHIPAEELPDAIARAVESGASRIAVAGGDGTVGAVAACIAGTPLQLAVIPGGTLNHFSRDLSIPDDLAEAAELATEGRSIASVDVGRVGDRLMLNTSAVGAYTAFVRARERYEKRLGYRLASLLAAFRVLTRLRPVRVELEVEGKSRVYHTPLLFVGVGERELRIPMLGARVKDGRRGLHVLIVRKRSAWGFLALALVGALRGVREVSRSTDLDSFIVDRIRVHLHRRTIVAVDGELVTLDTPVEYRLERDALRVVVPGDAG